MRLRVCIDVSGRDERGRFYRRSVPCDSLVLAFIDLLNVHMSSAGRSIVDTGGTARAVGAHTTTLAVNAGAAANLFGVMIGSGSAGVALADRSLQTLITHGTGAAQVSYGAVTVSAPSTSGDDRLFTIARSFTGNAIAAVNVEEVALYARGGPSAWYFCIDRTLNSFVIPKSTAKTVTYTIRATV